MNNIWSANVRPDSAAALKQKNSGMFYMDEGSGMDEGWLGGLRESSHFQPMM